MKRILMFMFLTLHAADWAVYYYVTDGKPHVTIEWLV